MIDSSNLIEQIGIRIAADKILVVQIASIMYFQAVGAKSHIHLDNGSQLIAEKSIFEYCRVLKSSNLMLVNHRCLVNIHFLFSIGENSKGHFCVFRNKITMPIHSNYLKAVKERYQL
jgi:DNA-binding LytR/AlgR family response regulator